MDNASDVFPENSFIEELRSALDVPFAEGEEITDRYLTNIVDTMRGGLDCFVLELPASSASPDYEPHQARTRPTPAASMSSAVCRICYLTQR